MGEIVAAVGVPHTPANPELVAREGPSSEIGQLYGEVAEQLAAVSPDVLVVFDSDHLNTFFLDNFPSLCIGVAPETTGPNEVVPAVPTYSVPIDEPTALQVYSFGLQSGFDFALTQEFQVDHSVIVPLHFLTPRMDVPIVPIYVNGIVPPLPQAKRCFALGQMVREAIGRTPAHARVAVLASGSIALDIGSPLSPPDRHAGLADPAWVRTVRDYLVNGQIDDLLDAATTERLLRAGNIGGELLNWIALLGAIGDHRPRFLHEQNENLFGAWRWD